MAPVPLPNLYALPNDVFDYMSTEGVDLRLDDHRQSTGQKIIVRTVAVEGAATLAVTALQAPLLRGTVLQFDGGGMEAVVQVVLATTATFGATTLSVVPLSSVVNAEASAQDSGVNLALAQRLMKGCQYGTSQVKLYCCGRYDDSDLATCWSANRWATVCAGHWVARRVCRPCPKSIREDYEDALMEMKEVMVGSMRLEDIPTRTAGWPFISNTTVDIRYNTAKVRVEPSISEATPTQFPQRVDWSSVFLLEY